MTDNLVDIGRSLLPAPIADRWLSLLRPGIRLKHATEADPVVGWLGGDPALPPEEPWPTDETGAPLHHLMSLDLAILLRIDFDLPAEGLLEFFCDGPSGSRGRVRYFPSASAPVPRAAPAGIGRPFTRVDLTSVIELTSPDYDHSYLHAIEADLGDDDIGVLDNDAFWELVDKTPIPSHRVGGYGRDIQYAADYSPSSTPVEVPGPDGPRADTTLPLLLAQIDTDDAAGIGWGDVGTSLWTITREDLAARRFDDVGFGWSSS